MGLSRRRYRGLEGRVKSLGLSRRRYRGLEGRVKSLGLSRRRYRRLEGRVKPLGLSRRWYRRLEGRVKLLGLYGRRLYRLDYSRYSHRRCRQLLYILVNFVALLGIALLAKQFSSLQKIGESFVSLLRLL